MRRVAAGRHLEHIATDNTGLLGDSGRNECRLRMRSEDPRPVTDRAMLRLAVVRRGARDIVVGRVVRDNEGELTVGIVMGVAEVRPGQGQQRQQQTRRYRPRASTEPLQEHMTTVVTPAPAVKGIPAARVRRW